MTKKKCIIWSFVIKINLYQYNVNLSDLFTGLYVIYYFIDSGNISYYFLFHQLDVRLIINQFHKLYLIILRD